MQQNKAQPWVKRGIWQKLKEANVSMYMDGDY